MTNAGVSLFGAELGWNPSDARAWKSSLWETRALSTQRHESPVQPRAEEGPVLAAEQPGFAVQAGTPDPST